MEVPHAGEKLKSVLGTLSGAVEVAGVVGEEHGRRGGEKSPCAREAARRRLLAVEVLDGNHDAAFRRSLREALRAPGNRGERLRVLLCSRVESRHDENPRASVRNRLFDVSRAQSLVVALVEPGPAYHAGDLEALSPELGELLGGDSIRQGHAVYSVGKDSFINFNDSYNCFLH